MTEAVWSDDGFFSPELFNAKYGIAIEEGSPSSASTDQDRRASWRELLMPADHIPRDLRYRLREFVPRPPAATLTAVEALPTHQNVNDVVFNPVTRRGDSISTPVPLTVRNMESASQHDLMAALRLISTSKISITDKNHWPTPSAIRQMAVLLTDGDYYPDEESEAEKKRKRAEILEAPGPMRAFAWPLLLQAGNLAQMRDAKLQLTKAGQAALFAAPHETLRDLWSAWVGSDLLDELRRINVIHGQTGKGRLYLTDTSERRQAIADALSECPAGKWILVDEFSRYMQAAGHRFDVSRNPWSLYIGEQQYGALGFQGFGGWNILQLRYILCVLMEYAATLDWWIWHSSLQPGPG